MGRRAEGGGRDAKNAWQRRTCNRNPRAFEDGRIDIDEAPSGGYLAHTEDA